MKKNKYAMIWDLTAYIFLLASYPTIKGLNFQFLGSTVGISFPPSKSLRKYSFLIFLTVWIYSPQNDKKAFSHLSSLELLPTSIVAIPWVILFEADQRLSFPNFVHFGISSGKKQDWSIEPKLCSRKENESKENSLGKYISVCRSLWNLCFSSAVGLWLEPKE